MRLKDHRPLSRLNGFSLVEAAIVLGVVGLVVGAILMALVSVKSRKSIDDFSEAMLEIKTYLHEYVSADQGRSYSAGTHISSIILNTNIYPPDWVFISGTSSRFETPAGYIFRLTALTGRFAMTAWGLNQDECIKFVSTVSAGMASEPFLKDISIFNGIWSAPYLTATRTKGNLPFIPTATECASPTDNMIDIEIYWKN